MVLIALLVLALGCLVLGLVLPSAAWLIASLVVTAVAAILLVRMRASIGSAAAPAPAPALGQRDAPADSPIPERDVAVPAAGVAHGEQRTVWVVDGLPDFHAAGCSRLEGANGEEIPTRQAAEDGFRPCIQCAPPGDVQSAGSAGSTAESNERVVWVVDGRPRYHAQDCAQLRGADAAEIPHAQASEAGFVACPVCVPDAR